MCTGVYGDGNNAPGWLFPGSGYIVHRAHSYTVYPLLFRFFILARKRPHRYLFNRKMKLGTAAYGVTLVQPRSRQNHGNVQTSFRDCIVGVLRWSTPEKGPQISVWMSVNAYTPTPEAEHFGGVSNVE